MNIEVFCKICSTEFSVNMEAKGPLVFSRPKCDGAFSVTTDRGTGTIMTSESVEIRPSLTNEN
jgi:hypothetical protein